jgi:hypothetical protein
MNDYEKTEPVKARLNPWKAYSLYNKYAMNINPTLGLPELEREEIGKGIRLGIEMLREHLRLFVLPVDMLSIILKRYPRLKEVIYSPSGPEYILFGFDAIRQIFESASDGKWDRNLLEWISISRTALEKGSFRAASRKHYAIDQNKEKIYLSPSHIKKKTSKMWLFMLYYAYCAPYYFQFAFTILDISGKDPELKKEFRKLELQYLRKLIPEYLERWKNGLLLFQGDTKGIFKSTVKESDRHPEALQYYRYIEYRFKDKELYERQKLDWKQGKRKAKPDGWKTCHTVKANG